MLACKDISVLAFCYHIALFLSKTVSLFLALPLDAAIEWD